MQSADVKGKFCAHSVYQLIVWLSRNKDKNDCYKYGWKIKDFFLGFARIVTPVVFDLTIRFAPILSLPGDLKTRKSTSTSCQIKIHFLI